MIEELATFIATNVPLVLGETIFMEARPKDAPADCSMVKLSPGGDMPVRRSAGIDERIVQVITRGTVKKATRDAAFAIFDVLHGQIGINLPVVTVGVNYIVNTIKGGEPTSIGFDSNGRFEYSANYTLLMQDNNL